MIESSPGRPEEGSATHVEAERQARQRKRSIAIALSLLFLAVLFYVVTLVKMGGALTEKAGS
jgi:hypothetical protein